MSEPLDGFPTDDGRIVVPEPTVKRVLAEHGIAVPRGSVVATDGDPSEAPSDLIEPLVLKAFGPGIVHKSELGAVRLGLGRGDVSDAITSMSERVASMVGAKPAGFLVEEQHPPGVELIVGVVRNPAFGPVVALGLGGTLAEVLDQVAVRLFPLDRAAAADLIDGFPASAVLDGIRGAPAVDRDALVELLVAIAGVDGVVARIGDELSELECNPVVATSDGVVALDARLVLDKSSTSVDVRPPADFTRLFRPRGIAVAGASTSRSSFGNRALAAYRAMGWTDGLYAIHPTAAEVDGVPAFPSATDIEDVIDYLLVAVPADRCADLVRSTEGRVPFIHVISGGFSETGSDGARLDHELAATARQVGSRVVGPNCIGAYCPAGRQTFQLDVPKDEGHVSVVSQSGGLAGDIIKAGAQRGVAFSKVITVGNSVDVTAGELVDWMVDDPDTDVIGMYLEGTGGGQRLVDALRRARGKVPTVLLLGGQSRQGAAAVMSHTGSLVGEQRVWKALAQETGTALVSTLEQLLAVLQYLERWHTVPVPGLAGVLAIGMGGGASVLATDASDRAGLTMTPTVPSVREYFRSKGYGAGTSLANPVEIPFGPAAPIEALRDVLDPLLHEQHYADVMVHINVQSYYSYGVQGIAPLMTQLEHLAGASWPATRLALVLRNLDCAPADDRDRVREAAADFRMPVFDDLDEAATAIAAIQRFDTVRTIDA